MCSFVGFNCNYTSASWIFLEWALTCIPLRQFRSLANKALQVVTLWMAASNKGAHHVSIVGLGISPSHALNIIALHFLSPNKEDSKYLFCLGDLVGCPQIVSTRREWSKSLRLDVATSICPPPSCPTCRCRRCTPSWTFFKSCPASKHPPTHTKASYGAKRPPLFSAWSVPLLSLFGPFLLDD